MRRTCLWMWVLHPRIFFFQYLYDDMSTCINMCYHYSTTKTIQLITIPNLPWCFPLFTIHPLVGIKGQFISVNKWLAVCEHATWSAPSGGTIPPCALRRLVGHPEGWWWSHRVADNESYQHWHPRQKQPWVVAYICRCVVPEVLGATFGITPAGNGELGLLDKATASGCIGTRCRKGIGAHKLRKTVDSPCGGPCWDRGTSLPKV